MRHAAPSPIVTPLRPTQALALYVERGTLLHAVDGTLHVTRWLWLSETLHEHTIELRAGERLEVDEPGWMRLEARHGAELCVTPPPAAFAPLHQLWAWLATRLRVHRPSLS